MIQPIVEGHGEVAAVPVLLRRLIAEAAAYDVQVGRPFRQRRSELVQPDRLKRIVNLAWRQPGVSAVIIIFDADDDCPMVIASDVLRWAREVQLGNYAVVVACREYEAWFLASVESLRGCASIRPDATYLGKPEAPRGAKEALEELMSQGAGYVEVADQPSLSAQMDLSAAYSRSRSFRHLVTCLTPMLQQSQYFAGNWPPATWHL